MKVAILQTDICWRVPADNYRKAERLMELHPEADLYVLPEMFSTGFCMQPSETAEEELGDTLLWMKSVATSRQCAIAGSVAVRENGCFYNRFYFVHPDGSFAKYDKRHLFTYGKEYESYTGGRRRVIVEFKGFRILLQVCYDLRFPVWSRCRGREYDVILYVASWPVSRREVWDVLLKARALENQCYVIGVNRTGDDPACKYNGGSVVVSPYGKVMVACEDGKECSGQAELVKAELEKFRSHFPALDDADEFFLVP
ncbi:amidohydrolase [uncultured Bacteroides sp.]|uniref:amidohydrolase n=1 Tax=uncultured Bacteroides sp. TaxID=162156 RepID=UPI00260F1055|nr:amidohydrolase [uncultured Bacteroides sp.]